MILMLGCLPTHWCTVATRVEPSMRSASTSFVFTSGCRVFWALATASGVVACGGSANVSSAETTANAVDVQPAAPTVAPTDYLPSDTYLTVDVDVARLRASPHYESLLDVAKSMEEVEEAKAAALETFIENTSHVVVTGVPRTSGNGGDVGVMLFEGDYEPGQPEATLRILVRSPQELRESQLAGHHVIDAGSGMLAQIDERHWLLGPSDQVKNLIQTPPGAFSAQQDPAWREAEGWLQRPRAAVTLRALGTPSLRADLTRDSPMDAASSRSVRAAAASFDLEQDAFVEAMFLMDDPAVAANVVQSLQSMINALGQNVFVRMMGLSRVLETVTLAAEGTAAGGRAQIPEDEVRRLLGLVPNALQMRRSGTAR